MSDLERCKDCGKYAMVGDAVTIPVAEYEALKAAVTQSRSQATLSRYRAVSRSNIARNPEIANFILDSYQTSTIVDVAKAAAAKFGANAPSRSAIHRFLKAVGQRV